MSDPIETRLNHSRSSRHRYRGFVQDYKHRRLDDSAEAGEDQKKREDSAKAAEEPASSESRRGKRREYARAYLCWLWPHRYTVGALFVLALLAAGLEMVEPLFMRFIIDRVLLNTALDSASRLNHIHLAGALFVGVVVVSKLIGVFKDYRQRLVHVRVMLSLRQSLFERLLHLPLPKLWT
jgi:ATP-binding cassette subfamily B protein/subfamily B ATP-binding cassette protein MsbA